ncbi:hypothetical protein P3W55_16780 [Pseudomonas citronellolis]|uniref:Phage tail protein n=1 Tax=Pseudomonas citronellolis TaxID=53408 RepID=A0AAW6P9Q6_9PSED|nr:hypothetical protein [Pseudomonas citronellolis]MDF3843370.1 hypothetical protein [Pseudomonas citronellolis]
MAQVSKAYADLITHTRSSAGSRINAQGKFEMVAANLPRFDYDPVTLSLRGLLVEEQRTNLLIQSDDYSTSSWMKSLTTVESSSMVSPVGGAMQKLVDSTTNDLHSLYQICSITGSTAYCYSVHTKQGERRYVFLNIGSSRSQCAVAAFDLQTGTLLRTYNNGNTWAGIAAGVINCGNGVYRLWVSATSPVGATSGNPAIWLVHDNAVALAVPIYVGDGVSGAYLWGQQFEAGAFPTSHIPTTSAQVTRAADVASVNTLSPWFNPTAGTLFVDCVPATASNNSVMAALVGDSAFHLFYDAVNQRSGIYSINTSGNLVNQIPLGRIRGAVAFDPHSLSYSVNGSAVSIRAQERTYNKHTELRLGRNQFSGSLWGHLRSIRYFPRRFTNAELQALTA